jgi:hypothetical protein
MITNEIIYDVRADASGISSSAVARYQPTATQPKASIEQPQDETSGTTTETKGR